MNPVEIACDGDVPVPLLHVQAASDVYAPVSGEVLEVNSALADEPANVNKSPYGEGWFAKIRLSNKKEASRCCPSPSPASRADLTLSPFFFPLSRLCSWMA